MATNFQSPNLQKEIIRKRKVFPNFSPFYLLIIFYQLTKFEAPSCYSFQDIMITNFRSPNLQMEIVKKKKNKKKLFSKFSPSNLLIILYQLTKFEAPSCYTFRDIMITNFQSPNLQREIIRKKILFLNFTI